MELLHPSFGFLRACLEFCLGGGTSMFGVPVEEPEHIQVSWAYLAPITCLAVLLDLRCMAQVTAASNQYTRTLNPTLNPEIPSPKPQGTSPKTTACFWSKPYTTAKVTRPRSRPNCAPPDPDEGFPKFGF